MDALATINGPLEELFELLFEFDQKKFSEETWEHEFQQAFRVKLRALLKEIRASNLPAF